MAKSHTLLTPCLTGQPRQPRPSCSPTQGRGNHLRTYAPYLTLSIHIFYQWLVVSGQPLSSVF
nr:MAG TPA: hypothetical protein [Caudoviricetes sp.]